METREQPEIRFEIRLSGHPLPDAERTQLMAAPGFGSVFTDHMVTLRWTDELGWHDGAWVPTAPDMALYIRPFIIATQRGLGVNRPSDSYQFTVIASPVGGYFTGGVRPVTVWLSREYTRAAPGGTGEAKCGGNYAA